MAEWRSGARSVQVRPLAVQDRHPCGVTVLRMCSLPHLSAERGGSFFFLRAALPPLHGCCRSPVTRGRPASPGGVRPAGATGPADCAGGSCPLPQLLFFVNLSQNRMASSIHPSALVPVPSPKLWPRFLNL